jgi:hypothetical protein
MYLKMHHIDFFMKFLLPRNINLLQLATHYYCLSLEVLRPLKNAILRRIFLRTLWIFQTLNFEYAFSHTRSEFFTVWDGTFSDEQKRRSAFDKAYTSIVSIKTHYALHFSM